MVQPFPTPHSPFGEHGLLSLPMLFAQASDH